MKKPLSVFAVVMGGLAMVLLSAGAYAANPATNSSTKAPNIQQRFKQQQERINEGVKAGSLTKEEAALVQDNLNRIMASEAELRAAGKLTPKEKERLHHKLDLNSKMIKVQKKKHILPSPPKPDSPAPEAPGTTSPATPVSSPVPSTSGTTPPATPVPTPAPSTSEEPDMKSPDRERTERGQRDMGRRHMSKEAHERMKADRKAEREKEKAERKARHHKRDKDNDDDDDDDHGDRKKGKKERKHGRERD